IQIHRFYPKFGVGRCWACLRQCRMNLGQTVFSQLLQHLPHKQFQKCVARYGGDSYVKSLSCWDQFLAMVFAQLTYRESLRDIEACLRSIGGKRYHMGFRSTIARSTLADANESRDWRIYADFGDTEQLSEQQELLIPAKYRVIPCGINFVAVDPQLLYLFCGGLNPGLVPLGIQHRFHSQTGAGSCRANQVDHRFQVPERLPFPGQTDKREYPMLDPVPLTRITGPRP